MTRRPLIKLLRSAALAAGLIAAAVTLLAAYSGYCDPARWVVPALLGMMLPGILIADAVLCGLTLLVSRRLALITAGALLASLPPILAYSPVNIPHSPARASEKEEKDGTGGFTLLTYNVLQFWDFRGQSDTLATNATIDYILSTDADIVNLQEAEMLQTWPLWHITTEQIRQLKERYPYRIVNAPQALTVLSKYPLAHIDYPVPPGQENRMALFRLDISGRTVHLMNVHLESIGLDMADKALYERLFDTFPSSRRQLKADYREVKQQLVSKLARAFRRRTQQARTVRHAIDSIGGDFIVAGDFNDIQASYAVRTIMAGDMHDAYAECALGPCITYHGNRFYFRIDHVLYGGALEATGIERAPVPSSDHYPLLTSFEFTP